ncbi:hypothetical protein [Synechococcus phage BUCT-ZZ01]|nr:hypothetical protein [Synechococcus phage BUCT-ZZ01]
MMGSYDSIKALVSAEHPLEPVMIVNRSSETMFGFDGKTIDPDETVHYRGISIREQVALEAFKILVSKDHLRDEAKIAKDCFDLADAFIKESYNRTKSAERALKSIPIEEQEKYRQHGE